MFMINCELISVLNYLENLIKLSAYKIEHRILPHAPSISYLISVFVDAVSDHAVFTYGNGRMQGDGC
jgi:hypothetical protein